jgi:hypothetical protein
LLDRSTFGATSTALLQNKPIQSQIASSAVDDLYGNVDVTATLAASRCCDVTPTSGSHSQSVRPACAEREFGYHLTGLLLP